MIPRFYRLLLRLYPAPLREQHREEMLELFEHQRRRGRRWLLVLDFLSSLAAAHAESARRWRAPRASEVGSSMGKDMLFAVRTLRRSPGVSSLAVLALALGIGGSTAVFSVVHAVALRPLPYPGPDRLVIAFATIESWGSRRSNLSLPDLRDIQKEASSLESIAGYSGDSLTLTGMGNAEVVRATQLTDGLLRVFGLKPILGRDLEASDAVPEGPRVAVIGYQFWQDRLGGENPLGRRIVLEGEPHEIVGVAPSGFDFPDGAELYRPLYLDTKGCGRGCHVLKTVGRLGAQTTIGGASDELEVLASRLESEYRDTNSGKSFRLEPLEEYLVGASLKRGLFVLLASVSGVLLIACANVAHLLLAKASERAGEMAVRSALGASASRLLRQLLVEALALALLGGLGGIGLAALGVDLLLALAPSNLPRADQIGLDSSVLVFALLLTLSVSIVFGLAPALDLSRRSIAASMGHGSRAGRRRSRSGEALLAAQVALSLVLLFAAGLLLRSFGEMRAADLGFDKEGVLTFDLSLPEAKYADVEGWIRTFERVEARLRSLPGVPSVGSIFGSPMGAQGMSTDLELLDREAPPPGQEPSALVRVVTPGYLGAVGATLRRGRGIEESDRGESTPVAFVNQAFVKAFYEGKEVLGQQIRIHASTGNDERAPRTIVGVMADVRSRSVMWSAEPEVYVPFAQMGSSYMTLLVRSRGDRDNLLSSIQSAVEEIDPDLPLRRIEPLSAAVDRSMGPTRFYFLLLASFALFAVLLAAIGLYGVVTFLVSRRSREIGIRMALGARTQGVLRLVVVEALRPALAGVVLGLGGAYLTSRALSSLLYNVGPFDPRVLALVSLVLLSVAVVAVVAPALRATRISPASTLRADA